VEVGVSRGVNFNELRRGNQRKIAGCETRSLWVGGGRASRKCRGGGGN